MTLAANTFLKWPPKAHVCIGLLVTASLFLSACSDRPEVITFQGPTMGTRYNITLVDPPETINEQIIQVKVEEELVAVNQWMSNYLSDSEISLANKAPIDKWFRLSEETYSVIETAQKIAVETTGSFDITVLPLVNLWGFGPQKHENLPTDAEISAVRANVGWQYIELDPDTTSIRKILPVTLDLSSIAKGFGVDYLCDLLDQYNIDHYLVEIGGEIRVKGYNADNKSWRIGIESPTFVRGDVQQAVAISNKAIATSGDYRNYYEKEGVRYSHTIDPLTGKPVEHTLASVTVIADSATEADAWATAFNVMGPDRAIELAEKHELAVYLLIYEQSGYESRYSSTFTQYIDVEEK